MQQPFGNGTAYPRRSLTCRRNLLTHTAGLAYDVADPDLQRWSASTGRTATCNDWSLAGFATPLKFPPGSAWCYGTATDWAAQALERTTGEPLSAYVQRHIFDPSGMKDSTWWPEQLPPAHARDEDGSRRRPAVFTYRREGGALEAGPRPFPDEHEIESGGSGLFTTARDYAAFMQALLAGRLLADESVDLMFSPQLDREQEKSLSEVVAAFPEGMAPEYPPGLRVQHGIGGILSMEDCPGKRAKGSMSWSGYANSRWVRGTDCFDAVPAVPAGREVLTFRSGLIERTGLAACK
jgi:CubicO group peptidase (beta-lactamase class C family)